MSRDICHWVWVDTAVLSGLGMFVVRAVPGDRHTVRSGDTGHQGSETHYWAFRHLSGLGLHCHLSHPPHRTDSVSLCGSGYPGSDSNPPFSVSLVLRLQG